MRRLTLLLFLLGLCLPASALAQSDVKTGSITASSDTVKMQALNKGNGTLQITGTWTATLRLQCKVGTGSITTVNLVPITGGAIVTSVTANGMWSFAGGFDYCEVNASAFTSGTAVINLLVTNANVPVNIATLGGSPSLRLYATPTVFTELLENSSGAFLVNMSTIKPAAPSAALAGAGAGNVDDGTHVYCVTFITATGETECSASSSAVTVADKTVDGKVTVTFTASAFLGVTGRNVYRSAANTTTPLFLVATSPVVNNNTATTYTDNIADASLTATQSSSANTTDDLRASLSNNGAWTWRALAAPGTPASGFGVVYIDSTSKNLAVKNDAGTVNHGIQSVSGAIADDGSITSTGTGGLVRDTSPTLTTPTLGVATATTINKVTITAPASGSTLTIADGKTLTVSNILTFTGTDSSSVAFGAGGTVAYTANKLSVFAATTSAELAGVISDETGSGLLVFATSPTLTTPNIGAATATSVTGNAGSGSITFASSPTIRINGLTFFNSADTTNGVGQVNIDSGTSTVPTFVALRGGVHIGTASGGATSATGTLAMSKITTSGSAVGAGYGRLEVVCGTGAGTAKLIMYAGTSATASTVVDNVGGGVTGC